jgi:5'(3')-deoxyribonucleotidase
MVIGIDVDGVLACFESGFKRKLELVRPDVLPKTFTWRDIDTWDWDLKAGYTKLESGKAWDLVKEDTGFWISLEAYADTRRFMRDLAFLTSDDDVYFITNRMGVRAKVQTETWLRMNGWDTRPTVILAANKGLVCQALYADFYLDDKNSHVEGVKALSPRTRGFMLKRGWNTPVEGVPTIRCLREYLNAIREAKGLPALPLPETV